MHLDELLWKSQGRFLRFCFLSEISSFLAQICMDLYGPVWTLYGPCKNHQILSVRAFKTATLDKGIP